MPVVHPECGNPTCRRTTPDGGICAHCWAELAERLSGVPDLLDDLLITYSRQDRMSGGGGAPSSETPLPARLDLPDAIIELHTTLTSWARDLVRVGLGAPWAWHPQAALELRGRFRDPAVYVTATAALWLGEHVRLIRAHPDALSCHRQLDRALRRARAKTDRAAPTVYRGPCVCGEELRSRPGADVVRCRCGRAYDGRKTREWLLEQAKDQLCTAAELASALSGLGGRAVSVGTVHAWHSRGRLAPRSWLHDGHQVLARPHRRPAVPGAKGDPPPQRCCRPLYRVGDATDLLATLGPR